MAEVHGVTGEHDGFAFLKQSAEESGNQRAIAQELSPLVKSQVGRDDRALVVATVIHQAEEIVDLLRGGGREVSKLFNEEDVEPGQTAKQRAGRAVTVAGV